MRWFGIGLLFLFILFISFLWMCLALATANAWVFQGTFSEGWASAWDRWYITIGWALLFLGGTTSVRRS